MKNKVLFTIAIWLLGLLPSMGQSKITISGYITDSESGETLIGAGVLSDPRTGAVTNPFGYYSLTIPSGKIILHFSYLGYKDEVKELGYVYRDTLINISLKPSAILEASTVTALSRARQDAGIASSYLGSIDVPLNLIQNTPVLFGEADVLKALQKIPGVQGGTEGFTGLYVRGGGADENLILLDGMPMYNVDHMLGIFSVFQTEAVKKVTLYKGSFPARYGGRISSIVDIRTNDGNLKEHSGSVTVGLLNSRMHTEGPILKDRLSYSFSARGLHTFYILPLVKLISGKDLGASYYFYDLNGKLTWRISDSDRFYFGGYSGVDRISVKSEDEHTGNVSYFNREDMATKWGNNVVHLRWNHVFSGKLFSNTTVAYNRYKMNLDSKSVDYTRYGSADEQKDTFTAAYDSGIRDYSARMDLDWHPSPRRIVRFGGEYIFHTFRPESLSTVDTSAKGDAPSIEEKHDYKSRDIYNGHEIAAYGECELSMPWNITFDPGMRVALFVVDGKNYVSLQPRINIKYDVHGVPNLSVKAGYSRMAQYVHLLSSVSLSMPTDLWVPITRDIRPVTSDQVSAGIYYDGLSGWEFSVEGYYKKMYNILEYSDGTVMIGSSSNWETRVEMGEGRARGLEIMAQKTAGKLTGWLAYTLSKSERRFPGGQINNGKWFPYRYDRRHCANANLSYKLSRRCDFNVAWTFASGNAITMPDRRTVLEGPDGEPRNSQYVSGRNNYRMPSSHHMDVSLAVHKKKRHGQRTWTFGVYNIYNQLNPNFSYVTNESVFDEERGENDTRIKMRTVTILPFIPSISYTREF